jgi:predicted RNase H-like nuclease (RuvC/YqgF family)
MTECGKRLNGVLSPPERKENKMLSIKEPKIKKDIELAKYKNLARQLANEVEYLLDEIEMLKKELEQLKNKK